MNDGFKTCWNYSIQSVSLMKEKYSWNSMRIKSWYQNYTDISFWIKGINHSTKVSTTIVCIWKIDQVWLISKIKEWSLRMTYTHRDCTFICIHIVTWFFYVTRERERERERERNVFVSLIWLKSRGVFPSLSLEGEKKKSGKKEKEIARKKGREEE